MQAGGFVVSMATRWLQSAQVDKAMRGDPPCQRFGAIERTLQPGQAEIAGGRISLHASQAHGEHGSHVLREGRRLGDAAPHHAMLAALPDQAQRVKLGAGG